MEGQHGQENSAGEVLRQEVSAVTDDGRGRGATGRFQGGRAGVPGEDREVNLEKIREKTGQLSGARSRDSFIQMNMDAQMNIPICILAGFELVMGRPGHEKFEEMGKVVDVSSLYDAAS
eukprot:Skav201681  [mRNA]  locus=scaffold641:496945:501582:- [translate_table: standard]